MNMLRLFALITLAFLLSPRSALATTIETLQVSSLTPALVTSSTTLGTGITYMIEAKGTYTFSSGNRLADAEFWYNPDTSTWYESIDVGNSQYNLDLIVNGVAQDWLGSTDGINYYPHTFSPDHTYRLFIQGEGNPVSFYIYDSSYDWNEGGLTVTLSSINPSPTPTSILTPTPTPTETPIPTPTLAPTATPTPVLVGPPTNKDQCKKDGWRTFNNPTFKNQGDCVSYLEKHEKGENKSRGDNLCKKEPRGERQDKTGNR